MDAQMEKEVVELLKKKLSLNVERNWEAEEGDSVMVELLVDGDRVGEPFYLTLHVDEGHFHNQDHVISVCLEVE